VTLHANSIAGALYNNKCESSETPMRTGTVTVYCRSNDDRTRKVVRYRRNVGSDSASRSRISARQFAFSVICSADKQIPKVQDQHGAR